MKTVMKKLFGLMLVAALLVSAIPAVFAAPTCETHTAGTIAPSASDADKAATCTETGIATYVCTYEENGETKTHIIYETLPINPDAHNSVTYEGVAATCSSTGLSDGTKCSLCGKVLTARVETPIDATNHKVVVDKAVAATCTATGLTEGSHCELCNTVLVAQTATSMIDHTPVTVPATAATCTTAGKTEGSKCSVCEAVLTEQTTIPALKHTIGEDGKCTREGCNYCIYCKTDPCSCVTPGKSTLKVFVNLYTADVKTKTYELTRYENISSETKVYPFISARIDELNGLLPDGYTWSGNVYDADNDRVAEGMNTKVGSGRTVYINAYTGQDRVYIYVHNSRSYSNIRVIQLDGKKVGDNVSRSEVWKAVSKYYSLSSLYMFDEDGWEAYVKNDKTAQDVESLKVDNNVFEIHVRISGSSKSSGSTADSSNPKTGDDIFAPVMVLGVSASALAVLFYLNKKRAF